MEREAALDQGNVKIWQEAAISEWFVSAGVLQGKNLELVAAPKPDFRHFEPPINLQLVDSAAGKRNFQDQIRKFLFFTDAPGFIGFGSGLLQDKSHCSLAAGHDLDPSFEEIVRQKICNPFLDSFVFVGSCHNFKFSIQVIQTRSRAII